MLDKQETKITIGMAAYNAAAFIRYAIESVLKQTHSNFELIIYNDGSTDDTALIISGYKDERIKFIDASQNRGVSIARQITKEKATGEWLTWLDADDIFLPRRLEKMLDHAWNSGADIVSDKYEVIDVDGKLLNKQLEAPDYLTQDENFTRLFERNRMLPHPLISKHCFQTVDYDTRLSTSEDYDYWLKCVYRGFRFSKISDVLLHYRIVPGSLSSDNMRSRTFTKIILSKYEVPDIIRLYQERGHSEGCINYMATLQYLFRDEKSKALEFAKKGWMDDDFVSRDFYLGTLLLYDGQYQTAERILKRHLDASPNSPAGWNNFGVLKYLQGEECMFFFKKAVQLFSGYEDANINLSSAQTKRITFTQLSENRLR